MLNKQKCEIHNLNKEYIYLFFNNYERDGIAGFFGKQVRKISKEILNNSNSHLPVVSHVGFLFYDMMWRIADLDYYAGGLVIRNISDDEIGELNAIYPVVKSNDGVMKSIHSLFANSVQECGGIFPSLKGYDFKKCIEYLQNENIKCKTWHLICLKSLNAFQQFLKNKSKKWTCIEVVFHVLRENNCNILQAKSTPQSLLIDLHNANVDTHNATNKYITSKH